MNDIKRMGYREILDEIAKCEEKKERINNEIWELQQELKRRKVDSQKILFAKG